MAINVKHIFIDEVPYFCAVIENNISLYSSLNGAPNFNEEAVYSDPDQYECSEEEANAHKDIVNAYKDAEEAGYFTIEYTHVVGSSIFAMVATYTDLDDNRKNTILNLSFLTEEETFDMFISNQELLSFMALCKVHIQNGFDDGPIQYATSLIRENIEDDGSSRLVISTEHSEHILSKRQEQILIDKCASIINENY